MLHSDFIKYIAHVYKPKVYLELGVYEGETFEKVHELFNNELSKYDLKCIAVDIEDRIRVGDAHRIPLTERFENVYIGTTDDFFAQYDGTVDMVFIDADHSFESVKRDFTNAEKILNPGGVIILHDTDPDRKTLLKPGLCGDSHRMVNYIEIEMSKKFNIVTLPVQSPGLSIITRKQDTRCIRKGYV